MGDGREGARGRGWNEGRQDESKALGGKAVLTNVVEGTMSRGCMCQEGQEGRRLGLLVEAWEALVKGGSKRRGSERWAPAGNEWIGSRQRSVESSE